MFQKFLTMTDTISPLSRIPITIGTEKGIVISIYTEIVESPSENSLPNYFTTIPTTIPTKLVKLVREKRLTDFLDWVSDNLGITDNDQAIAYLKACQGGVE